MSWLKDIGFTKMKNPLFGHNNQHIDGDMDFRNQSGMVRGSISCGDANSAYENLAKLKDLFDLVTNSYRSEARATIFAYEREIREKFG